MPYLPRSSNPPIYRFLLWGGGSSGNKAYILTYDVGNPQTIPSFQIFEEFIPKNISHKMCSFGYFGIDEYIFSFGGYEGSTQSNFNEIHRFDTNLRVWETLKTKMPETLHLVSVIRVKDTIH